MPSKEEIEVPSTQYFTCMKSRCKEVAKVRERDFKAIRTNKYKIKGTIVPHEVKEKIYDEQSKSKAGTEYTRCAVKQCSQVLQNMLSQYKKHCEAQYKTTKLPYYKKVIERINAVDLNNLSKTPPDKLFKAIFID
jgi:hypothetical protein